MRVRIRISGDQVIDLSLVVAGGGREDQVFDGVRLDNPFAVTANPNADREEILRLEGEIATVSEPERRQRSLRIAELHRGLREYERARQLITGLLKGADASETVHLLNVLAGICEAMGDDEAHIDYLREAVSHGDRRVAGFNLAHALKQRRRFAEALAAIDDNIKVVDIAPAHALRAEVLERLGRDEEAREAHRTALELSADGSRAKSEYEIYWARYAAEALGRKDVVAAMNSRLEKLRTARRQEDAPTDDGGGGGWLPRRVGGTD